MKKIIALILLGLMLPVLTPVAAAQAGNPSGEELEAISKAIEADADTKVGIMTIQADLENPEAAAQEQSSQERWAAHLEEMEHWSMGRKLIFGVKLLVLGMIVVMGVLILIAVITGYLNNLEIKHEEEIERRVQTALKERGAATPLATAMAAATVPSGGIDGATVAAIAGAVTAVLHGRRFRIKSLKLTSNAGSAWSQHGRQSIMASHSLERKSR